MPPPFLANSQKKGVRIKYLANTHYFMAHIPVLLKEAIDGLDLKSGDIFVDATLGGGGHTKEVCRRFEGNIKVIGIDQDSLAIEMAKENLKEEDCRIDFEIANFRDLDQILDKRRIKKIDAILFDLGLSSYLIEKSGRGFTFRKDEPLIMNFKRELAPEDLTASEIVNKWSEKKIADILKQYGEERYAKRIAREIAEHREKKPIRTTSELVEIIRNAVPPPYRRHRIHFATRTFQALRIAVNDELDTLHKGLEKGFKYLSAKGRMVVISFHSLEDRIVKQFFNRKSKQGQGIIITKKPMTPSEDELRMNPRARSAKLRIIEKAYEY